MPTLLDNCKSLTELQVNVLVHTISGLTDDETAKAVGTTAKVVGRAWLQICQTLQVQDRLEALSQLASPSVAVAWQFREEQRETLRQEVERRQACEARLDEMSVLTYTGGWQKDATTGIVSWTSGCNAILGRDPFAPPLPADEYSALVHPDDRARHQLALSRMFNEGKPLDMTYRLVLSSGIRIVYSRCRVVTDEAGEVTRYVGTVQDITEITEGREAAVEATRLFESIAASVPDIVQVYDLQERRVLYSNRSLGDLLGYEAGETMLFGSSIVDRLVHPEDRAKVNTHAAKLQSLEDGNFLEVEYRLWHSESRWITILSREVVFKRDEYGNPTQILGISRDVTERRRVAEALRKNEQMVRLSFDDAPIGMAILTPDAKFERVNDAYCSIFGYTHEELVGQSLASITPEEELELFVDWLYDALENPDARPFRRERQAFTKRGREIFVSIVASVVRDENGKPIHLMRQVQDVTAKRLAEEQLKLSLDRVTELNGQLESKQKELEAQQVLLQRSNESLQQLAITDALTGLRNRRMAAEFLEERVAESTRYGRPLSVAMIDVDHFKSLNDRHGHLAGDDVLRGLAQVLVSEARNTDFVARYGGEEFLVVMPETPLAYAATAAERFRSAVEQQDWTGHKVTISVGVAAVSAATGGWEHVVDMADKALYSSKQQGRNRVTEWAAVETAIVQGLEN